jgi:hypothetical protein
MLKPPSIIVSIMPKLPKGPKDKKLELRKRRPKVLPTIYVMNRPHPKRANGWSGRNLYFVQDISTEGMTAALQAEVDTPILYGNENAARDAGELHIHQVYNGHCLMRWERLCQTRGQRSTLLTPTRWTTQWRRRHSRGCRVFAVCF